MAIMKLAAILRIADALDSGHAQKFDLCVVKAEDQVLRLFTDNNLDNSLEKLSVEYKSDLFEEIYGMNVILTSGWKLS